MKGDIRGYPNFVRTDFGDLAGRRYVLRPYGMALQTSDREIIRQRDLCITPDYDRPVPHRPA